MNIVSFAYLHRKQVIFIVLIAVLVVGIALRGNTNDGVEAFTVTRQNLAQEVQLTGAVTPKEKVDLGFERPGIVARVLAPVGTHVRRGQLLATLTSGTSVAHFNASKAQTESATALLNQFNQKLLGERARFEELRAGARKEELSARDLEVFQAYTTLDTQIAEFGQSLEELFLLADKIITVQIAPLFNKVNVQSYKVAFESCDPQAITDVIDQRYKIDLMLQDWNMRRIALIPQNAESLRSLANKAQENIFQIDAFLTRLSQAVLACNGANTVMVAHHATINNARDQLKKTISVMLHTQNAVDTQTLNIKKLLTERDLSAGSARDEQIAQQKSAIAQVESQIASQKAQIIAAHSQVAASGAQLAQGAIRAPFAGIITKNSLQKGGIAPALSSVITLIDDTTLHIESFVPETDIGKLKIGQKGKVTLDAYGNETLFEAVLERIEPAETKIEGVATYKTIFTFIGRDSRVLSGMTANVTIVTAQKTNVLVIPFRAFIYEGEKRFVKRLDEKKSEVKVPVVIGLRGENGMVEVVSGLKEGDTISL